MINVSIPMRTQSLDGETKQLIIKDLKESSTNPQCISSDEDIL